MAVIKQVSPGKRLYSIKELSEKIGGSIWFWRSRIWSGDLPVINFGRKQLVDIKDVERLIEQKKGRLLT